MNMYECVLVAAGQKKKRKKKFKPMTGPSKEHFLLSTLISASMSGHHAIWSNPRLPHSSYGCRHATVYSLDQRLPILWEGILKGTVSLESLGICVNKYHFHLRNDT